jgi:hypothetical protein
MSEPTYMSSDLGWNGPGGISGRRVSLPDPRREAEDSLVFGLSGSWLYPGLGG